MVTKVNKLKVKQKEVRVPTTTTTCAGFRIEGVGDSFVIKSKDGEIVRSGVASEDEAIAVINRDLAPIGKPTAEKETEIIEPEKTLPQKTLTVVSATIAHDGFDDTDIGDQRLIHGMILKCVDGDWSDREGTQYPIGTEMLALNTAEALQRWSEQRVVDTIVKVPGTPLPDTDSLNAAIPQKTWEKGNDNKPRPPWQHVYIVYLLRPTDASVFTLINNTTGMRICYDRLKDKVRWMRTLRNNKIYPLIKLDNRPMSTAHGIKKRPELTVLEWRDLSGTPAIEQTQKQIGQAVAEVSSAEAMNDSLPF